MSLVIAKIDKDKKEQTIYSDGILANTDGDIISQFSKKIWSYNYPDYSILIGTCGDLMFNRFVGLHLPGYIKKYNLNTSTDYYSNEETMIDIYYSIINEYKTHRDNSCNIPNFTHVIIINGVLFRVTEYDKKMVDCRCVKGDYVCIGMGCNEANALMMNDIEIPKIFDTINKINCFVGNIIYNETQKYN